MKKEDLKFFDDAREEMTHLLCRLIEKDTTNPPGNEERAARVMHEFLDENGITFADYEKEPGRTNVVATIGGGRPALLVAAHLDVVPAGEGWDTEPFKPTIRDGRVYGRGTVDNKGQLAAMLVCAKFIKEHKSEMNGSLVLVGAADEERGSAMGLDYLVKENLVDADAAIIPDIANNMRRISVGEKGLVRVKVESRGIQAHASTPDLGFNAIWPLVEFLHRFRKAAFEGAEHALFSPPTKNVGIIKGGAAVNIVPAHAEVEIDFRYLPGTTADEIIAKVNALVEETAAACPGSKLECTRFENLPPFVVSTDEPLVKLIRKNAKDVLGIDVELMGMAGTTVCKQLIEKGIVSVGYSCGDNGIAHIANEYIAIDEMVDFAKVMAAIILDFCG